MVEVGVPTTQLGLMETVAMIYNQAVVELIRTKGVGVVMGWERQEKEEEEEE